MARFEIEHASTEIEKIQKQLGALSVGIQGEITDAALTQGGEGLSEYFVGAISDAGLVDNGDLLASIKPTPVNGGGNGKYVDVYPQGTRSDGKRNAEIGAYQEYGTKRGTPATHWMSNTVDSTEDEIATLMEEIVVQKIDEILGGN